MSTVASVVQAYLGAWNRRDADGIVQTFVEGGTYSDPLAQGLSGPAIAAYARGLWQAFPDLSFDLVGQTIVGDGVVAMQWRMSGTNTGPFRGLPPSGRSIALHGADFIVVEGDKIRSVQGYFDAGEVPRQLGLQVLVQPYTLGPFQFGYAAAVQSGKPDRPKAFSITAIRVRSDGERERVREYSRKIAAEMLTMPGFIGWAGVVVGDRMLTVTAWGDTESPRQLTRAGVHLQAMREFFNADLGSSGYTSVWVPERFSPLWVRCPQCGRMGDSGESQGLCVCGTALPEPLAYW
ncbi:MAG TPA: ester cyclase [Chloroflexota bacterium]